MDKYHIIDIVQQIKESADEIKQKEDRDDMDYGTLLGLCESLSIIRDVFIDYDLKELGLDFDIDKEYL